MLEETGMINSNRSGITAFLSLAVIVLLGWSGESSARYEFGNLEMSGEVFVLADFRLGGKPEQAREFGLAVAPGVFLGPTQLGTPSNRSEYDTVNALRTELSLELVYKGIKNITPVLKLRAYYDGMFDINDKDRSIARSWETNLRGGTHDSWDPLIREAYLDFNYHPLFVRAGRQIVTWGRSDGVTVLDVITPRNFRNPLTFEQERFMIPQDMLNIKLDLSRQEWIPGGISKELQVVWNWDYTPARFPGFRQEEEGQHPYSLAVVDFADQIINVSEGLFGESDFFNGYEWDDGDVFDKSEVFVRWRARTGGDLGPLSDMSYSFHYGNLNEDIPFYILGNRIDPGFALNIAGPRAIGGGIDFERHRYQMVGASFDKALEFLPGQLKGTVIRGEIVYNFGQLFYEPDLETVKADQVTALIGLDQYIYIGPKSFVKTPWFVSAQFWRDEILRDPGPGQFSNINTGANPGACAAQPRCGERGYLIGGAATGFDGQRGRTRHVATLFMFNDFLPGKTLHVELFGLHEFGHRQRSTWVRGLVGYNFNNSLSGRVGINVISGAQDAFFGQFQRNDSVFTELKFTF
jgi:hypothetical protein